MVVLARCLACASVATPFRAEACSSDMELREKRGPGAPPRKHELQDFQLAFEMLDEDLDGSAALIGFGWLRLRLCLFCVFVALAFDEKW